MRVGFRGKSFGLWLPLALIMGLAAAIRWRMNFSGLMPGINGPYYPVQVRALLETGRLAFPDFPLVFWLEALVAKLLFALKMGTLSDCIMWASKGVDALFPTLVAVPAYLLARAWISDERPRLWPAWVVAAFSVLFLFALFMTADLQKNSAGAVWLFFFIYYLYQALRQGSWRPFAIAGVFFLLTGLTHIGCFGVAIVFLLVVAVVALLLEPARRRIILRGAGFLLLLLAVATVVLYLFFDPERVERLLTVFLLPAELFEKPMLFTPLSPFNAPPLVVGNMMAIAGVILLVRRWRSAEPARRLIVLAAVLLAFLLSSPVFGQEWATRLSIMAHIPATVLLAFLLVHLQSRVATFALTAGVLILLLFSVMVSSGPGFRSPGISEASYEELQQLRGVIAQPGETLVLARHGLEWWAAWVLETDVGQRPDLGPEVWDEYFEVLYLEQIAGAAGFGPAGGGPLGPPFPEVRIPPDAEILFEGQYFRLARVTSPPEWYPERELEAPSAEKLRFVKKIKVAEGFFPGIIFTNNRFFVSYESDRRVLVRVYDEDLAAVGKERQLTGDEGADHQIVFGDGYFYLANSFYLRKFDSNWNEMKRIAVFAKLPFEIRQKWSPEEGLDDILLYYADGSIYLGIASGNIPPGGKEKKLDAPDNLYIREYDRDLKLKNEAVLRDVGNVPGSSLFSQGETFTVVSSNRHWDDSNLIALRYDRDWNFINRKIISAVLGANEEFPMGVLFANGCYFVGYHHITGELSLPAPGKDTFRTDIMLKMFDSEWNLLGRTKVTDDVPANNRTLFAGRPHLAQVGKKIYVTYDSDEDGRPGIFVKEYEVIDE